MKPLGAAGRGRWGGGMLRVAGFRVRVLGILAASDLGLFGAIRALVMG